MAYKDGKVERVLQIYTDLKEGKTVDKNEIANEYGVNVRSIERDIEDIRNYFESEVDGAFYNTVQFDKNRGGYILGTTYHNGLSNGDVLAVCKILLDSRAFPKDKMELILNSIIRANVKEAEQREIIALIKNEAYHYIELSHKKDCTETLWDLGRAIQQSQKISITYRKLKSKEPVVRVVQPLAISFCDFYFYLIAFIDDVSQLDKKVNYKKVSPTVYRVDRIDDIEILDEKYRIPYQNRFEEGEFRKRVQFMLGGELKKVHFIYSGLSIEAIEDRLPTAVIKDIGEGCYDINAEVYGDGLDMWLRSWGDSVKNISIT